MRSSSPGRVAPPQSPEYTEYFPTGMTSQYLRTQGPRVLDADGDGLGDLVWVEITVDPEIPTQRNRRIRYKPHAKAGELCERVNTLHLVAGGDIVGQALTYRGEGHAFL